MAVVVNRLPPIAALQQQPRPLVPQVTARGRQLQSSPPPIPQGSGIGAGLSSLGKSLGEMADTIKESRQQANRRKVVESMVALDEMGEGDAFDATVPQVQVDGMEGMMVDSGEMGGPSAPATPKRSPFDELNMPKSAQGIFKDLVKAGSYDDAYKIAMSFAMQAPKEYTLGKDQVVMDKDGKVIAQNPNTSASTEKPVKAYNKKTGQFMGFLLPSQINADPNLVGDKPSDGFTDRTQGQIAADINNGMSINQLNAKYGSGVIATYGNEQLKSRQPSIFVKDGMTYTKNPPPATFFPALPSRQQNRTLNRMAISPPNANSNMPTNAPAVNSNMQTGEPVVNQGQVPTQSAAPAPEQPNQQVQPQQVSNQPFVTPLETPLVQTAQDKIKMQDAGAMVNEVNSLSADYRALVTKHGPQMLGMEAEKMSQAHTFLIMKLKDLMELGVLAGPDLDLLEKLITPPDDTSLNAQDAIPFNGYDGTQVMLSQLDQLDKVVADKYKAFQQNFGPIAKRKSAVEVNVPQPKRETNTSGWQLNLKKADK